MILFSKKLTFSYEKKTLYILALKFGKFAISQYSAFQFKEINKVLKWPRQSSPRNTETTQIEITNIRSLLQNDKWVI